MSNEKSEAAFGQCLCGAIKYRVQKIQPRMGHCHCNMCRKFHGAAFATYGVVKVKDFTWLSGSEHLRTYVGDNGTHRQFCDVCGSSLIFKSANDRGENIEFALGTLDTEITQKPDAHIFRNYAASWYQLSDDLPQFGEYRSSTDDG
ncbi:MAG: GFA family protein [Pseudomonadota bacterium]